MAKKKAGGFSDHQSLTQRQWLALAFLLFKTTDKLEWSFVCPRCSKTWTVREFRDAGGDPDSAYQECIGRRAACARDVVELPKGMCDWAAFGLFRGPWVIAVPGEDKHKEREVPVFAFKGATPELVAKAKAETAAIYAEAKAFQDAHEAATEDEPEAKVPGPIAEASAAGFMINDKVGYKSVIDDKEFQHVGKVRSVHPGGIPSCNEPMLMIEGKGGVVLASHCTLLERATS